MFFGPSRFIWFSIGSLATFAWMHYRRGDHLNCRRTSQIGYEGGSGHGQWYPQGQSAHFDHHHHQQQWGSRQGADGSHVDANGGGQSEPPPAVVAEASGRLPADREYDRLREMSRNAEETVSWFYLSRQVQRNNNELFFTDKRDVRSHYRQYDGRPTAFERCASLIRSHRECTVLIVTRIATG